MSKKNKNPTNHIQAEKIIIAQNFHVAGDFGIHSNENAHNIRQENLLNPTVILGNYQADVEQGKSPCGLNSLSQPEGQRLSYTSRREDGCLVIQPSDPYLNAVRTGGELTPLEFWSSPWEYDKFSFPALDIKILNNTSKSLFFHEILLRIKKSRLDPRPIPIFKGVGYNMRLPLMNAGWGPMKNTVMRFALDPIDESEAHLNAKWIPMQHINYPFTLKLGNVIESTERPSMERFFSLAGVDMKTLKNLRRNNVGSTYGPDGGWVYFKDGSKLGSVFKPRESWQSRRRMEMHEYDSLVKCAYGPFQRGLGIIRGEIEYTQTDSEARKSRIINQFSTIVAMGGPPCGAPAPPSYSYQIRLDVHGDEYSRSVPISHVLAAGESDRFLLFIAAEKSSLHEFDFEICFNDTEKTTARPVKLEIFVSRLDAYWIAEEASGPAFMK